MKKFTNKTNQLRSVVFVDGSAQFLMRGQSFVSDKEVKSIQEGIVVKEAEKTARKAGKTEEAVEG